MAGRIARLYLDRLELRDGGILLLRSTEQPSQGRASASEPLSEPDNFIQGVLDKVGNREQPQGVAGRRCVEDNAREFGVIFALDKLDDLDEGSEFLSC